MKHPCQCKKIKLLLLLTNKPKIDGRTQHFQNLAKRCIYQLP